MSVTRNADRIAEEILRIIGEAKLPMGDISEAGGLMSKDAKRDTLRWLKIF